MKVSFITDPEQKESISLSVMHRLPLWFSPPEDIDRKAVIHRDYPFFAVFDRNKPVASCLYTQIPESRINTELFNHHQKTEYPYNHTENAF